MYMHKRNNLFSLTLAGALLVTGMAAQAADGQSGFVYVGGERGVAYNPVHAGPASMNTPDAPAAVEASASGFRYVGGERGWAYLPVHEGPAGAQAPGAHLYSDGTASGHYVGGELGWVSGPVNPAFEARIRMYQDSRVVAQD